MKSFRSFISVTLPTAALCLLLAGCTTTSWRFWESSSQSPSLPEVISTPVVETSVQEEALVYSFVPTVISDRISSFDISTLSQEATWRIQAMNWLDRDRMAVVFADGKQSSSGAVIMAKAVMFDWSTQQESAVITLPDVTVNRIDRADTTLFFYDSTTVYSVDTQNFSLLGTAPNASGSAASGSLLLRRDDSGVTLEGLAGESASTRVARNDDTGIYGSQLLWAPDGQKFAIVRQDVSDQSGNGVLIGSRSGELLTEIDISPTVSSYEEDDTASRYEFTSYWSADSRSLLIADTTLLRNYDPYTGDVLGQERSALLGSIGNIRDVYGNRVLLCKPGGSGWLTAVLDLSTGESVDLLETPQATDARFSPNGSQIVAIERENARQVYLITP